MFRSIALKCSLSVIFSAAVALTSHSKTLQVRDFGAKGDGIAKDTLAIQRAIDAAGAKGGGVLEFTPGTYLSGTLYMRNNVKLSLCGGAILKGSPDRADYCAEDAFPQNAASKADNTSGGHLLVAAGCTNVVISGPGRIDGNSAAFLVDPKTGKQYPGGKRGIPWRPAQMLYFVDCKNVTVERIFISNAPYWSCFMLNCDNVFVRQGWISTERRRYRTWNGDGLDIDRCTNVRVVACTIDTYDDALTIRASCASRLKSPMDCSNVVVSNCTLSSDCNAVRIGVGEGVIRNCSLSKLKVYDTRVAFSVVSGYSKGSRGVDIRDVEISDSELDCRNFVDIGYRHAAPEAEIRDISFRNIRGWAAQGDVFRDEPGRKLENLVFDSCSVVRNVSWPRTSVKEFLMECVDHSRPGLEGIPARMAAGDEAGAMKLFADHVRETLTSGKAQNEWYSKNPSREKREALRRRAEKVMDYTVSACGIPHRFADRRINWKSNPTYNAYKEWPWQLGRCNILVPLAAYYRFSGDERAAATWRDMVSSWIDQAGAVALNLPPGATVMWRSLDTGLRVSQWVRQIYAFAGSPELSDEFIVKFFRSVHEHACRLHTARSRGNWKIMELNGLMHVAVLFPFLSGSDTWRESALLDYRKQLDLQVYPDGFQYELAPGYHGVIPGDYSRLIDLYRLSGRPAPDFMMEKLEKAYDIYPRFSRPDRKVPGVNDALDIAIVPWMQRAVKIFPAREDFMWFATSGKKGSPPSYLSCVFPYAGMSVFRSSWDEDAVWGYMDSSPFGHAHQHEDSLNVLLSAYGKNMIVDAGNYDYDTSEMRKYVLSTRSHNTIMVDGRDQSSRRGWKWKRSDILRKADVSFRTSPDVDVSVASYTNGYGSGSAPVMVKHTRSLMFFKKVPGVTPFFVCVDRLESQDAAEHRYDSLWHLETSVLSIDGVSFNADFGNGIGLDVAFSDASAMITDMKGSRNPYMGWMPIRPSGPHDHRPIPTPVLKGAFSGGRRIVGVFHPYRNGERRIAGVEASGSIGEKSFVLILADGRRLALSE